MNIDYRGLVVITGNIGKLSLMFNNSMVNEGQQQLEIQRFVRQLLEREKHAKANSHTNNNKRKKKSS